MYDIDDLKNLVDMAAGGRSPADLLITNAKLVDVLTGEIRETDVSVGGGKILGFSHTEAVKVVDARGAYLLPGLIDAHIHIESSMVSPARFAGLVLPHGTTSVVADPHEIANVHGRHPVHAGKRATPAAQYFYRPPLLCSGDAVRGFRRGPFR